MGRPSDEYPNSKKLIGEVREEGEGGGNKSRRREESGEREELGEGGRKGSGEEWERRKGERGNSSSELAVFRDCGCRGRRELQDMRRDGARCDGGCGTPGRRRGELDQRGVCIFREGGSGRTEAVTRWNNDGGEEKSECTRIQNASENGKTQVKMAKHSENGKTRRKWHNASENGKTRVKKAKRE